jgi:SAM-dependent methyltransferase
MSTTINAYDEFAMVYANDMAPEFANRILPAINELVLQEIPAGSAILDLCCGPAYVSQLLAERGFEVTGLDSSEEMLRLARRNAPAVRLLQGEVLAFRPGQKYAAVISTFNSLAHVSTPELEQVFQNVASSLKPNGLFCFDLTMEEGYLKQWHGSFSYVHSDHACIIRPEYDVRARVATNRVTIFSQSRDSCWSRNDFCVDQFCHSEDAILSNLAQAGLTMIESYSASKFGFAPDEGRKIFLSTLEAH